MNESLCYKKIYIRRKKKITFYFFIIFVFCKFSGPRSVLETEKEEKIIFKEEHNG